MTDTDVLIVGAGPTGLVLALSLARQDVRFRIIDRASGPGQASRALVVHARVLEFYRQLGIAEDVVARGVKVDTIRMRAGGRERARLDLKDMGRGLSRYPFALSFPQDDHERFLAGQLATAGITVEWGVALIEFTQDQTGVSAILEAGGARETVSARYLCGCDGGHSTVRTGLGIEFPGGTYNQRFYVADVEVAGERNDDLSINLDGDGFGLMLPVRSSGARRLIGLMPLAAADAREPTFAAIAPIVERLIGIRIETVNWFSTYRVHHRVAARFRFGRCFLLGDAGHVHSPAGGQGMNTGIGDAVNLAWKLAQAVNRRMDPAVLDTYETERIAFARTLVATTDRAFQGIVGGGLGGRLLRTLLAPRILAIATRFAAVRRAAFKAVSQIRIHYRMSTLSEGAAGDVHGGDRLPWVAGAAGEAGNYAPLRTLDWQAHVYGDAPMELTTALAAAGVPLHVFVWSERAKATGLERDALYLVRPDGHVALAARASDDRALAAYLARIGLRLPSPPQHSDRTPAARL